MPPVGVAFIIKEVLLCTLPPPVVAALAGVANFPGIYIPIAQIKNSGNSWLQAE